MMRAQVNPMARLCASASGRGLHGAYNYALLSGKAGSDVLHYFLGSAGYVAHLINRSAGRYVVVPRLFGMKAVE
jgi:hypothetical protein